MKSRNRKNGIRTNRTIKSCPLCHIFTVMDFSADVLTAALENETKPDYQQKSEETLHLKERKRTLKATEEDEEEYQIPKIKTRKEVKKDMWKVINKDFIKKNCNRFRNRIVGNPCGKCTILCSHFYHSPIEFEYIKGPTKTYKKYAKFYKDCNADDAIEKYEYNKYI